MRISIAFFLLLAFRGESPAEQATSKTSERTVVVCDTWYVRATSALNYSAGGGSGTILASACAWTVTKPDWVTITSGGSSSGGTDIPIQYAVAPNPGAARSGVIAVVCSAPSCVDRSEFTVTQEGTGTCTYGLSSYNSSLPASGGTINVTLTTAVGCAWTVQSPPAWVNVLSSMNGTGPAIISFTVLANPGTSARNGTLVVQGQTISIVQAGIGGSGLRLVTLPPCRVMETRPEYNYQGRTGAFGPPYLQAGTTRTLQLPASATCPISGSAKAYLLNVTVIPRNGVGVDYITVYPTGETRPQFWTVRSPDAQIVANSAIVKAGTNGAIDVYTASDTDMIIDISGYFTDNANVSNLVYYPLTPCRVIETRSVYRMPVGPFGPPSMEARQTRRFQFPASPYCQVPVGAAAYSFTMTVVPPGPLAFITTWPAGGAQPNVSSINSPAGRILANNVVIPVSTDGSVDVFAYDRTDFLVDINGYFAPDDGVNGLLYYPVSQCRAADSTSALLPAPFGAPIYESQTARSLPLPNSPGCSSIPTSAKAFVVNVTALPNGVGMPFITAYPTGQPRPNASMLNAFQGQIVTNTGIIPAGPNGSVDIFPLVRTQVVVDISGYFGR